MTSMNSGDVYICVSGKSLYHWVGKSANVIEKARVRGIVLYSGEEEGRRGRGEGRRGRGERGGEKGKGAYEDPLPLGGKSAIVIEKARVRGIVLYSEGLGQVWGE